MSFHSSPITASLHDTPSGIVKIAGHYFPGSGDESQNMAAMEQAMVSIYRAIDALALAVERIDRDLAKLKR